MEQVGQRKIDGLWLTVVGIAVLFFLILPTLIVIPMSFSGLPFWNFRLRRSRFVGTKAILRLQNG